MSLRDLSCYTLTLIPSLKDPTVIELVEHLQDGKEQSRYARVRENLEGEACSAAIYGEPVILHESWGFPCDSRYGR